MPKIAELPNRTKLRFPDDTPDDVVLNKVLKSLGVKLSGAGPTRADVRGEHDVLLREQGNALRGQSAQSLAGMLATLQSLVAQMQQQGEALKALAQAVSSAGGRQAAQVEKVMAANTKAVEALTEATKASRKFTYDKKGMPDGYTVG